MMTISTARCVLRRGCVTLALLVTCASALAAANTYSGSLSNGHYRFFRPATLHTLSPEHVPFHAIYFTVQGSSPGAVTATVTGNGFTPRVHFYQNAVFDPYAATNNLWWMGTGTVTATNIAHGIEIQHLIIVSGTTANDQGTFNVTLTGPGPIVVATNNDSALMIRTQPQNGSITAGESAVVRIWASGRQPQKLQWYHGPKPASTNAPDPAKLIPGATNQSYFTPVLNQTTSYWCLVTGNNTTPTNARSSLATVNVSQVPALFNGSLTAQHDTWNRMTTNNVSSGKICYFEVVPFRIFSSGSYIISLNTVGFPGSINLYGPKFFPANPVINFLENGVVDTAAGALSYTTSLQPGDYEMIISSANGGQVGTYSGQITGPSVPQILPKPTYPVFLDLPKDRTILTNTSATLTFSVEGALPRTNQWYKGVPPDASQPIAGATNKSYTTPNLPNVGTNFYWARVANSFGATTSGPVRVKAVDGPIKFSGTLRPGNKIFRRSNGAGGMEANWSHYKTYVFEAPVAGAYNVALSSSNVSLRASVYQSVFLTNNPNVNLYELPFGWNFTVNVAAPSTFWLVISTTNLAQNGSYTGTITGPGGALINELPAPVFAPQPTPAHQFLWKNQDPAPIIGNAIPVGSSWSWFRGAAPGVPVDFITNIAGLNTRTNDQPASVTAQPTNLWFYARIDGSYGYDDSDLCMVEVSPPPRFMTYPTNRSVVYGNFTNLTTVVTNAPFLVRWFQAPSPLQSNAVQSDVIQGMGANYIRAVTRTNTTPLLNVGSYSYWLQSTNPSGVTNGPTFTITVTKRPLFVSLTTPQGLTPYDGLPHPASALAMDMSPGGPPLPNPLPIVITYQLPGGLAVTNEPVAAGTYQVVATVVHSNYMGSATNSFTISKRFIITRADDKYRQVGVPNPLLTISYTNFAPGDSADLIDVPPTIATLATDASQRGKYPITLSGGSDDNYTFNFVSGTLTIIGSPVFVAIASDFTSNAPLNGTLLGSAVVTNETLRLTYTNANDAGQLLLASPGYALRQLHAEFDLHIAGPAFTGGGFSLNYGADVTNTAPVADQGHGTGLSVVVDTFNDGGEIAPAIGVKYAGSWLAKTPVANFNNNDTHRFIVDVASTGQLTLQVDGVTLTNVLVPAWEPLPEWMFSLAGRSAHTLVGSHSVDNLLIGETATRVLVPTTGASLAVTLQPAFSDITNVQYSIIGNSRPAFATATLGTNGRTQIVTAHTPNASSLLTFSGTNGIADASIALSIETAEAAIISFSCSTNGTTQFTLKGPAHARYYIIETEQVNAPTCRTIATGFLDSEGFATATGPAPKGAMRCYRLQIKPE